MTRGSEFGVFANARGGALPASRRVRSRGPSSQRLEEVAKEWGAKGLAYLVYDGRRGPLADREVPLRGRARGVPRRARARPCSSRPDDAGDGRARARRAAPPPRTRARARVRRRMLVPLGDRLPAVRARRGHGQLDVPSTIPSRAPIAGHEERVDGDPGSALSQHYDLVWNGWELGSRLDPDPPARTSRRACSGRWG